MHRSKDQESVSDLGSERAVLSGICQFGKDAHTDVSDIINVDSFVNENNQAIYKCLEEILVEATIDIASVVAKAEQLGLTFLVYKTQEDIEYLRSLFNFPIKLENVRVHAKRVAKLELIRKARKKHLDAYNDLSKLNGSETVDCILGISEKPVFDLINDIGDGEDKPNIIGARSSLYIDFLEKNKCDNIGLPTHLATYNSVIGHGFRRGTVNLIGARPGIGKSTLAMNFAIHLSKLGIPILYLDTEMLYEDILPRILANISGINISTIEKGKFDITTKNRLLDANKILQNIPFFYKTVAGKNFNEIISIIRRWLVKEVGSNNGRRNNSCIILDYFKVMNTDDLYEFQEFQALGFAISNLADCMKIYDSTCCSFIQLNRDGDAKDVGTAISGSDRLLWLCSSFSILRKKMPEEILEEGKENGNMKLKTIKCRFGAGLDDNDHINLLMSGSTFRIEELGTKSNSQHKQIEKESGFNIEGAF